MPPRNKRQPFATKGKEVRTVVVVSDLHCGCRMGLCPDRGIPLDDGGTYHPSSLQRKTWAMWREFWDVWVPQVTHGDPFAIVVNGDVVEGVHHGATSQVSHNIGDQVMIARECLGPEVKKAAAYFHVRGTEAHVGPSAEYEERLARDLGAIPNEEGQHARGELWLSVGGDLVHFLHHISTTGSAAYEATAVHKELTESFVEAGRWGVEPPRVVVRSHRHRYLEDRISGKDGYFISVVTPAWQLKTAFAHKVPGARLSQPQIGGIVIRQGDEELHVRAKTWQIERPKAVRL